MNFIISILLTFSLLYTQQENPYVGTWESYDMKLINKRSKINLKEYSNFHSTFIFKEDSTFIKITNGKKSNGRYKFTKNKFKFYEEDSISKHIITFNEGWFNVDNSLNPYKGGMGLVYPENITVKNKKGEDRLDVIEIYYRKVKTVKD
jgi:hypothetical protein